MISVALLYLFESAGIFAPNGLLMKIPQKVTKSRDVSLDFPRCVNDWRRVEQGVYPCQLLKLAVRKITQFNASSFSPNRWVLLYYPSLWDDGWRGTRTTG